MKAACGFAPHFLQSTPAMKPLTKHTGLVAALNRSDVDTDQIMPKQFLKRTERTGFGKCVFYYWRFLHGGTPNPDFELNQPECQGASILLVGRNFGCGSSREHAPWGLEDFGFRVLIGSGFADIFFNNCFKNGMLPIVLPAKTVDDLFARAAAQPGYRLTVDLQSRTITDEHGLSLEFPVDDFRRYCLLNGLDDISLTLKHEKKIAAYEDAHGIA